MKKKYLKQTKNMNDDLNVINVKPKDLPKDIIETLHKKKVLKQKKYCTRSLIMDTVACIIALSFSVCNMSVLLRLLLRMENKSTDWLMIAAFMVFAVVFVMVVVGKILITLPKRIYNYMEFDFNRTCYAIIKNKYIKTVQHENSTSELYYADLQLSNGKYIKGAQINEDSDYFRLRNGDRVIVVSFDGYKVHVVELADY